MPESDDRPEESPEKSDRTAARDERTGGSAGAARMHHQGHWVDLQIQEAMARGDFDNLPGAGKPIKDLGGSHDPDWWLRQLIEREQITGVLPPSLALRKEDADLDDRLDGINVEREVRSEVEEFNQRVVRARYQAVAGPPLITQPRDVESTVAAWQQRRTARHAARTPGPKVDPPHRSWRQTLSSLLRRRP